ncbi:NEAT domain-containing protein [Lysinibacillus sp. NPDC097287]|uniref:NEAT domain-containing protein n=1 Tax=Lysinibacillus sp. NPDC097287 TaxID=3364144 RepID=UPI0037FA1D51
MMIMNRKAFLWVIVCIIFMALPSRFLWTNAHAEEGLAIEDGKYQVELSFPSLEGEQQDSFFSKEATLYVKNGLYKLSLPMVYPDIITDLQIMQLEKPLPFMLDKNENLVQFDMNDVTQQITINGTGILPFEEEEIHFTEQLLIKIDSLKFLEEIPPSIPEEEPPVEQPEEKWSLDYQLLVDGKMEPSIMNTYVNPTAKIIEQDGKYYAQLTIIKSSWITSFTVEQQGQQVEPKLVSLVDDVRVVQFEVNDFEKLQRIWVKVDIPELAYHHQYFVDLQFDKEQVAKFSESLLVPTNSEQPTKEDTSSVPEQVIVRNPAKDLTAIEVRPASLSSNTSTTNIYNVTPEEDMLAFDRTLDEEKEAVTEEAQQEEYTAATTVKKGITAETGQKLAQLDKLKIILLIVMCLLSGFMLLRRIKNVKQKTID